MNGLHISLTDFRNESRVLKETASLVECGLFESIVIIALHSEGLAEYEVLDDKRSVYRLRLKTRKLPTLLLFQLLKFLEFCVKVVKVAHQTNPEICNVHALALLPLGAFLKLFFRMRLVYDAHELETEVPGLHGLRQQLSRLTERMCMPMVDLTITVGPKICDWYRNHYQTTNVVAVLNCPIFKEINCRSQLREELGISLQKKIYLYQGALFKWRGIELLLEAFKQSEDNSVLVFMGYGDLVDDIKFAAAQYQHIYYLPAVQPSRVLQYTASADIGFVLIGIDDQQCLNNLFCLPNKLFEYAMAGVPMVCSPMPEMTALMSKYGIGVVIEEATSVAVKHAVEKINALDRNTLQQLLVEFNRHFCWEEQEKIMIDAYKKHLFRRD